VKARASSVFCSISWAPADPVEGLGLAERFTDAAAPAQQEPYSDDLNENFKLPSVDHDYTKREMMIPMRDGTKLFTVIWIPRDTHNALMMPRTTSERPTRFV